MITDEAPPVNPRPRLFRGDGDAIDRRVRFHEAERLHEERGLFARQRRHREKRERTPFVGSLSRQLRIATGEPEPADVRAKRDEAERRDRVRRLFADVVDDREALRLLGLMIQDAMQGGGGR